MRINGIIPINKPAGWTSFDVVNKLKHMLKPFKVGHLGTLDPMATGVLLVTVGKATRLFDIMQQKTKTYLAKFAFGYETDTLDSTGKQTNQCKTIPTLEQIKQIIPSFIGQIEQLPPKYSAKSVNGKRAYDLARAGVDFELKPKKVQINCLNMINYINGVLELEIECGSGTYVRSIGRDIAYKLATFATMTELTRTKVGNFDLSDCKDIQQINSENIQNFVVPIDKVVNLPKIDLSEQQTKKMLNGQPVQLELKNGNYLLKQQNEIVALVNVTSNIAKMAIFLG